jgi:hypothetical protein
MELDFTPKNGYLENSRFLPGNALIEVKQKVKMMSRNGARCPLL